MTIRDILADTPPCYRIRRADGRWFAGHDSRGHAQFKRDVALASVMIEAWAEQQAHLLRCFAHSVELVPAE